MNTAQIVKSFFAAIVLSLSPACLSVGAATELDKEFVLKKNESTQVSGAGISIKMTGNGTAQRESGGDMVFCKFEITTGGKTQNAQLYVGKSQNFGGATVKLIKVDTTTDPKSSDPWSTNSCSFIVSKAGK